MRTISAVTGAPVDIAVLRIKEKFWIDFIEVRTLGADDAVALFAARADGRV